MQQLHPSIQGAEACRKWTEHLNLLGAPFYVTD